MDLENTQNNSLAKLSLLKQGEYDTWRLRIESYIQLQDYALWEILEEGNSFKPVARTTTNEDGTSTTTIPGAVTAEQKILKKNDLKARSILMMTLPSEHLLTFNKHKDAKSLFEAIEARFGGWHELLVWRTNQNLGSISFDDLYNNFKIVEPEVKRSVTSSSNSGSQNLAFVSGHSSTNDVNTANVHVSTGSTPVSTASTNNSTACLSDATVYAYLATQPNGSQVVHEDLEQIHEDDLDEMDLKWQLALLSMKARKFYQRTGKKIIINGSDTAGYDKKKVECFNCHKLGHFARECRNPRSQENRSRSQDSSRRTVNVEESSSKAMLAIDGTGFDWSYMADEEASTNFALMAFSDSEVQNNKTCSKTCLKNFEDLKSSYDKLRIELSKSESDLYSYKKGLESVEERLVFYKKNERMLCDQIVVLKSDASFNESDINALKKQVERLKKEKEDKQFKIDNFENASKSLDQLIANQISDKNKMGLGYNVVPPPLTGLFAPPSIDLSNSGLEKFKQPEFEGYGVKVNKDVSENVSKEVKKNSDAPIIEDWVSDCDEDETVVLESLNVQKPKQADQPRKVSQNPRNNSTSWNTPMPKKLGVGFQFTPKACFVCGSFNHLIKDCDFHDKRMVQKPVLNNVKKGTSQREVRPVWTNAIRVIKRRIVGFEGRVFNSPYFMVKSWLVMDQTVLGQTATGKESSNPFMASSLPKTISPMIHISQEVILLKEERTGDLRMIFDPNKEDDIWLNQHYCELLRWKLHEYSGVHSLFLDGTSIQINMLVDKKYPLKKEILEKMINLKMEAEESDMESELIKFIKSQIAEQS
ncbi:ribonuclease H-like domain-containing protein [Tanacetum coccineum]